MAVSANVNELIDLAVQAERSTEALYRRLARLFAHLPEIARFIDRLAAEEAGHVVWLNNLRAKLTSEKLAAPAIPLIYQDAERVSQDSMADALDQIDTLEDAFQFLVEIVHGEANQVLEAIINTYYEDDTTRVFLLDHLRQHQWRVEHEFPAEYANRASRESVKAVRL